VETIPHHQGPALLSPAPVATPAARRRWRRMLPAGAIMVLVGLLAAEMLLRGQRPVGLAETIPAAKPTATSVQVVMPKRSAASSELLLPGNVQAVQEAALFARTNGYVHRRLVDIGDRVTAGQLLAEIESPEVD
jgi:multidrug efflux pump subunit AcrA (membrane-fusion protein)